MSGYIAPATATAATSFPAFPRLAVEIQLMIWEAFAKAEAASRVVPLNTERCPFINRVEQFPDKESYADNDDEEFDWLVLRILPLKRLASPLLRVCARSREVALKRYQTRVNLYEIPYSHPWVFRSYEEWLEAKSNSWSRRRRDRSEYTRPARYFHPFVTKTIRVWADRKRYCIEVENDLIQATADGLDSIGLADKRAGLNTPPSGRTAAKAVSTLTSRATVSCP
ncbi:hypothetical protein PG988_016134 [Apiospora saccharicola]